MHTERGVLAARLSISRAQSGWSKRMLRHKAGLCIAIILQVLHTWENEYQQLSYTSP